MVKNHRSNRVLKTLPIILVVFFLLGSVASAKRLPTIYTGVRALGMGGAFTAVANDENALFYNPAGISKIKTFELGLLNPVIEVSKGSLDLYSDAADSDLSDTGEITDLLRDYVGETQHLRFSLTPHMGLNFGGNAAALISGLGSATLDAEIRNPVYPEVHTDVIVDYGLVGGIGVNILPIPGLRVGVAGKMITRSSLSEVYTAADLASDTFEDDFEDDMEDGAGISADIGVIYTIQNNPFFDFDIGLVAQNVPSMDMEDAEDIDTQYNLGFAIGKEILGFSFIGAFDWMDFTNNIGDDDDLGKRLHAGLEVQLPILLAARVGVNQGYFTAGATVDFWVLKLDVATYGEEVGVGAGQKEDRRYVAQLTLGW
jgi:hypothetical protein